MFKLPPEILGFIFCLASFREEFENNFNFILVCRYWFEVASHIPRHWEFWGSTLNGWKRCYLRHPKMPLDLVLDRGTHRARFPASVAKALRDRTSQDTIQLVHLRSEDNRLLGSILRTLTADPEEVRCSRMESFILRNQGGRVVNVSEFFAQTHFPKLRHLDITNCIISPLGTLLSQIKLLTTLVLHLNMPLPTKSELFSLLASNPSIQKLALTGHSILNHQGEDGEQSRVSLPELKELKLAGRSREVSTFLNNLVIPDVLDRLDINLDCCGVEDISGGIGPYLRDFFRRRGRSQNDLGICASLESDVLFHVGDGDTLHSPTLVTKPAAPFLTVTLIPPMMLIPDDNALYDLKNELFLGLIACTPQEKIVYLKIRDDPTATDGNSTAMGNVYGLLPNLKVLHSEWMLLSLLFPKQIAERKDLSPSQSLRHLIIESTGDDWTPLTSFLSLSRTSLAKRLDFLHITSPARMRPEVEEDVGSSVQEFRLVRVPRSLVVTTTGTQTRI